MIKRPTASTIAIAICLGTFVVAPASAQSPSAAPAQDVVSVHHRRLYQLMKDMTREMTEMTNLMSRGVLTLDQQRQMSERMAVMSTMLGRMAGLEARPAMKEADWQQQMDEMRGQMDAMMRNWQMAPAAK